MEIFGISALEGPKIPTFTESAKLKSSSRMLLNHDCGRKKEHFQARSYIQLICILEFQYLEGPHKIPTFKESPKLEERLQSFFRMLRDPGCAGQVKRVL